jgi:glycosyltransferase involved in cell wall biosynthesis
VNNNNIPKNNIFVIVPAYNERNILTKVVEDLVQQQYTVVVIDDGSNEQQNQYVTNLPIHYLTHQQNLGQGAALETGTIYALENGAKYIVHFDADGQHNCADIPALLNPLTLNEADIVFGSRFMKKNTSIPISKTILLQLARYVNFVFTGILLTDAHNGLRALNEKAARKIRITENRMAHASEILFLVKKHKLRYTEMAVDIQYTAYSKEKGQSAWNSIRIFFDLLLHKLFE